MVAVLRTVVIRCQGLMMDALGMHGICMELNRREGGHSRFVSTLKPRGDEMPVLIIKKERIHLGYVGGAYD